MNATKISPILPRFIAMGMLSTAATWSIAAPPRDKPFIDRVYYDELVDATGRLTGGFVELPVRIPNRLSTLPARGSETILPTGDPANRVDVVFVGDGYTAGELGQYAIDVDGLIAAYFAQEPFARYAMYYNAHRVDVVSNESGVDNDPVQGINKDTALDMGFWCGNTERLLCVDVSKAYSYAANAPDIDLVAAIANSSKYGGAGYLSADLATASSRNSLSKEVLLHEFGHALGNLADEYNYGGGDRYTGNEVPEPNASILAESEMLSQQKKWWRWIGLNDPLFDGLVSTYEGCRYYQLGIYRPTNNSKMNSLNRPFNPPSVESILTEIYKVVSPIDDSSDTGVVYDGTETLFVTPMKPIGHPLDIQWYLDGLLIPGATNETLDLSRIDLRSRNAVVSVTVTDPTDWVRDESLRDKWMSQTLYFDVDRTGPEDCLDLYVTNLVAGSGMFVNIAEGTPNATVAVLWGNKDGSFVRSDGSWCVDFGFKVPASQVNSWIVTQGRFNRSGLFFGSRKLPASTSGMRIRFQAAEQGTCPDPCMSNIVNSQIE